MREPTTWSGLNQTQFSAIMGCKTYSLMALDSLEPELTHRYVDVGIETSPLRRTNGHVTRNATRAAVQGCIQVA